ncbi:MAG TPA: amidohydrolase [Thermoanaerobaculia bacterium]|nr:amidohydrolase [Thermoanaerobaculia bacterium]HEV8611583.1 amidohydrolase [Thermoanaerobaculia bacterium]
MSVLVLLLVALAQSRQPADLILVSARVWTGDPTRPEVAALAAVNGRVVAVGSVAEIEALRGPSTVVVDGKGRRVVPGFIDCHTHMSMGGFNLLAVDLRHTKDPTDFTARLAGFAKTRPAGLWLTDGAWDHQVWANPILPTRAMLDPATGDRPTCLSRTDGHMMVCNSRALELAKVTRATPDPPGGVIVRDPSGEPTGVLKDAAMDLIAAVRPARTRVEVEEALATAVRHAAQNGVTSVQDLPGDPLDLDSWDALRRAGKLTVRVSYRPPLAAWEKARDRRKSMKEDEWLRIGGVKGYMDGSLGSGTALFFRPYTDDPKTSGVFAAEAIPLSKLEARVAAADAAGLQVEVHAIGDRANAELLDIFERVAKKNGPKDRRFRVEHAQHLRPGDIPRFARSNVIASMQPYHAIDDGRWAEKRIGLERCRTTYAFRSLEKTGATVVFGSDWDVAPLSPLAGIDAAVNRRTLDGKHPEGWIPEQTIAVLDALRAYTSSAAWAAFEEKDKGTLTQGKLADFVVLSRDPLSIPKRELDSVKVDSTVVGGRVVYSAAR